MTLIRFLTRSEIWKEISLRIPSSDRVTAAVSYLGTGGADLLPLRKGDVLVVDMSLGAVRQGATNPKEVRKLMKRGVQIFTRSSLHAKIVVIDGIVIASSANASQNARYWLDEAGMLSDSPAAVKQALSFIKSLCSEPILDRYLNECIAAYRPPQFKAARTVRRAPKGKRRAQLWFIGGLVYVDPKRDQEEIEELERAAEQDLADPENSEVSWIRLRTPPRWFAEIQPNNWVIDCTRVNSRSFDVQPPARVIRKSKYTNKSGSTKYMLMLERPIEGESMTLPEFRRAWKRIDAGEPVPQRSRPILDRDCADRLRMQWTARGRVSRRK